MGIQSKAEEVPHIIKDQGLRIPSMNAELWKIPKDVDDSCLMTLPNEGFKETRFRQRSRYPQWKRTSEKPSLFKAIY